MLDSTYIVNATDHYRRTLKKQKSHSLNDYDLPTNKSIIYQSEPEKPLDIYIVSKIYNIVKYTFNNFYNFAFNFLHASMASSLVA